MISEKWIRMVETSYIYINNSYAIGLYFGFS